ncbi:D-2-hydroxyacid dehydrogenase family protein [Microbacterium sp. NPDC058342]|uniref:D-2-hydroxyacid dehydrogenase family protein n=1 Tax=Microbacterium sp. NPDC058342 TaxID=3346454 RepID=UPI00364C841E
MNSAPTWNVTVLDDYHGVAADIVDWGRGERSVHVRSLREHVTEEDALAELLVDSDVIVAMRERTPLPERLLERLPRLKLIVTTGMGNSVIDRVDDIALCGTRALSSPTPELTWALILASRRQLLSESAALRAGRWQAAPLGAGLEGSTIGIVGLGVAGERVARIAQAFGMRVLGWSTNLTPERASEVGAEAVSKSTLFSQSDVVSVHLRESERTLGIVDAAAIDAMSSRALLVNTSRAGIVDNRALGRALRDGRLGAAALDVFESEPLPGDADVREWPRTLLTPHLGYVTAENFELFFTDARDAIQAFSAGAPIRLLHPQPEPPKEEP